MVFSHSQFTFVFAASSFFIFPVGGKALFATSFIRSLRICTSIHCPLFPIRVTCNVGNHSPSGGLPSRVGGRDEALYLGNGDIDVETVVELFFHVAWFEDDADSEQVINLLERDVFGLHLVPDGVDRFHTCQNPVFQPHLIQLGADRSCEVVEYFVAFGGGSIQLSSISAYSSGVFIFGS